MIDKTADFRIMLEKILGKQAIALEKTFVPELAKLEYS
jgi:hypothetical protein